MSEKSFISEISAERKVLFGIIILGGKWTLIYVKENAICSEKINDLNSASTAFVEEKFKALITTISKIYPVESAFTAFTVGQQ